MAKMIAILLAASTSAALAHPSLVAHEHPHAFSALLGLDVVLGVTLVAAIAVVVWKRVRS